MRKTAGFALGLIFIAPSVWAQQTVGFTNTDIITINTSRFHEVMTATPYPSIINVSGFPANEMIGKITVTLHGLSHGAGIVWESGAGSPAARRCPTVQRHAVPANARAAVVARRAVVDEPVAVVIDEVAKLGARAAWYALRRIARRALAPAVTFATLWPHALVFAAVAVVVEPVADLRHPGVNVGIVRRAVAPHGCVSRNSDTA
jgi:hypothetical protein